MSAGAAGAFGAAKSALMNLVGYQGHPIFRIVHLHDGRIANEEKVRETLRAGIVT